MDVYPKGPDRRVAGNFLLGIITVLLVALALRLARTAIIPLLVAGFLAYLMDPLVSVLRRLKIPLVLGVSLAGLLYLTAFVVFGVVFYQSALDFARAFPRYQRGLVELFRNLLQQLQDAAKILPGFQPLEELQRLQLGSLLLSTLRSAAKFLREFLVIFIFTLMFLFAKYALPRKLLRAFPHKKAKRLVLVLLRIDADIRKYIGVKSLACLLIGTASGVCLMLFGVDFPIVFGFLTFLLNFVPVVGSTIAVILPLLIALVQYGSWTRTLWLLASLVVLQNLVAYLFEPKVLGIRLKISVPIILLSLFLWGLLWGAPGILLAVPLTTSLKIIMEDIPGLRPFALLLGKAPRRGK